MTRRIRGRDCWMRRKKFKTSKLNTSSVYHLLSNTNNRLKKREKK